MQPASDDVEDARVVVTCAKNNDGPLGRRTVWERRDGALFVPVPNFDFETFDNGTGKRESKVTEAHIKDLFDNGHRWLARTQAAERLQEIAGVGRSAAYEALKLNGRFADWLTKRKDGLIGLSGGATDGEDAQEDESPWPDRPSSVRPVPIGRADGWTDMDPESRIRKLFHG